MNTFTVLDPAESWLAKQLVGPDVSIYPNNADLVRAQLKRKLFEDVRHLVAMSRLEAPFDLREIARYRHVLNIKEDAGLVSREAVLVPTNGGFVITLSSRVHAEARKRFSCAHEIAHTYFYDVTVDPPRKFYRNSRYWVEEGYACEIAREILMPEPCLSTYVFEHNLRLSVEALVKLRKHFGVSYDTLGRRLLHDTHAWNEEFWGDRAWQGIIVIVLTPSPEEDAQGKWKATVYRSPRYEYKLKDVTSRKLERKLDSIVVAEGPQSDGEDLQALARIADVIARALADEFKKKKEETIKVAASSYHVQAQRVGKKSVLSVISQTE